MPRANRYFLPGHVWHIIDVRELATLCGVADLEDFQLAHRGWVEQALSEGRVRDDRWSKSIAVGSLRFVESVKRELRTRAIHRTVENAGGA